MMSEYERSETRFSDGPSLYTAKNLFRVAVVGGLAYGAKLYFGGQEKEVALDTELASFVETQRLRLPIKVDEITTVKNVSLNGRRITYTVDVNAVFNNGMINNIKATQQNINKSLVCSDKGFYKAIYESGVSISHVYNDTAGNAFDTIVQDCR
jgi:hypothetical protein